MNCMKNKLWLDDPEILIDSDKLFDIFPIIFWKKGKNVCKVDLMNSIMRSIIYLVIALIIFWDNKLIKTLIMISLFSLVLMEIIYITKHYAKNNKKYFKDIYNVSKENMTSYNPERFESSNSIRNHIYDQNVVKWTDDQNKYRERYDNEMKLSDRVENIIKSKTHRLRDRKKIKLTNVNVRSKNTTNMLNSINDWNNDPTQYLDREEKYFHDNYSRNRLRVAIGENNKTIDGYAYGAPQETAIYNRIPQKTYMDAMGYYDHHPRQV